MERLDLYGAELVLSTNPKADAFVINCREVVGPAGARQLSGRSIHLGISPADAGRLLASLIECLRDDRIQWPEGSVQAEFVPPQKERS